MYVDIFSITVTTTDMDEKTASAVSLLQQIISMQNQVLTVMF
jgi:hypothetical protein